MAISAPAAPAEWCPLARRLYAQYPSRHSPSRDRLSPSVLEHALFLRHSPYPDALLMTLPCPSSPTADDRCSVGNAVLTGLWLERFVEIVHGLFRLFPSTGVAISPAILDRTTAEHCSRAFSMLAIPPRILITNSGHTCSSGSR